MGQFNRIQMSTRRTLGCSRKTMAMMLNMSYSSLNMYERGERRPIKRSRNLMIRLYQLMNNPIPEDNLSSKQKEIEKAEFRKVYSLLLTRLKQKLVVHKYALSAMEERYAECHRSLSEISRIQLPPDDPDRPFLQEPLTLTIRLHKQYLGKAGMSEIFELKIKIARINVEIEMIEQQLLAL